LRIKIACREVFMKTQDVMDSLLKLGVQKGRITSQDLNDAFPADFFPLEEMERFLRLLEDLEIKIVDTEEKKRKIRHRRQG
jgi:RNA polymerase primary sigma factor